MGPPLFMRLLVVMCPLVIMKTSCIYTVVMRTKSGYSSLDGFPWLDILTSYLSRLTTKREPQSLFSARIIRRLASTLPGVMSLLPKGRSRISRQSREHHPVRLFWLWGSPEKLSRHTHCLNRLCSAILTTLPSDLLRLRGWGCVQHRSRARS